MSLLSNAQSLADQLWSTLWPFIASAVTAVAAYFATQFIAALRKAGLAIPHDRVEETHVRDLRIQDLLTELRIALKAKRASLAKIHNGEKYVDGSDLLKVSRTHESVEYGTSYQAETIRNVLVSTVPEEFVLVMEDGPSFRSVSELPPGRFRYFCEMGGVFAVSRMAIRRGKDVIGYLGVDFGRETASAPEDLAGKLKTFAGRLEGLLAASVAV